MIACASHLLNAMANVNCRDKRGRTPLMEVCGNSSVTADMIQLLLNNSADVKAQDRKKAAALLFLAENTALCSDALKVLLAHRANVKAVDSDGRSALSKLCRNPAASLSMLRELLQRRARVNQTDKLGTSALHSACKNIALSSGVIQELLHHRANIKQVDKAGCSPFHTVCENPSVSSSLIQELIQQRAHVNLANKKKQSALHLLCFNTSFPGIAPLLEARAEVNVSSGHGWAPLHYLSLAAGKSGRHEGASCLHKLLEKRADASALVTLPEPHSCVDIFLRSKFEREFAQIRAGGDAAQALAMDLLTKKHLCDNFTDQILTPLLTAQAQRLQDDALEVKAKWFYGVLQSLHKQKFTFVSDARLTIDRVTIMESMCRQMSNISPTLPDDRVTFRDESGTGPGLLRDLLSAFAHEFSNENYNLFTCTNTDPPRLALSSRPCFNADRSSYFEMVGRMIGMALLKEQRLPVRFSLPLVKQLLGKKLCLEDLGELDRDLYSRLMHLRTLSAQEIDDLDLDFTVDEYYFGKRRKVDLMLSGERIRVTAGNLDVYLGLYAQHRLKSDDATLESLLSGLFQFCPPCLLAAAEECFEVSEFDCLISGPQQVDIDDWQANTNYSGHCSAEDQTVAWFWEVVRSISTEEQKLLLRFATGQMSSPIGGFKMMKSGDEPMPFTIVLKEAPDSKNAKSFFPTASTCFNQLQLPRYSCRDDLRRYLCLVIHGAMMCFEEQH
eukprot:TRINITY_DN16001_c0_g1_i1.p1 TRINITY_DN16001_c0_g1~~TRINITY_DN16001_c0_g1_i1.p1  ORF type:complete len:727 (-),score=102.82 TRINITY_DN16001_c0_g1_i1:15-2195(-)